MTFIIGGFYSYLIALYLISGWFTLRYDTRSYKEAQMDREKKAARIAGWCNIVLGSAALAIYWIYVTWFW